MIDDLDKVIERMRGEIDDLQLESAEKAKPWYRDVATLVAALALVFSFGTTLVSYVQGRDHDIEDKRRELRTALQRLAALPKESVDAARVYASDPNSRNMVFGYINEENALLTRHAVDVVKSLPSSAVSAAEYQAVAMALQNSYNYEAAGTFLENAIKVTDDFNTEIASVRGIANLRFIQGHPEAGRVGYQTALDIFSKYPNYDPYTKASTNATTEMYWAYAEAGIGEFNLAFQHLNSADEIVAKLTRSPGANEIAAQLAEARQRISGGNRTFPPSSAFPPPGAAPSSGLPPPGK